jgi:hypothetical protein
MSIAAGVRVLERLRSPRLPAWCAEDALRLGSADLDHESAQHHSLIMAKDEQLHTVDLLVRASRPVRHLPHSLLIPYDDR